MFRRTTASLWERRFASAVRVSALGGPDVLQVGEYAFPSKSPSGSEVFLRHSFAGVNFIDTYFRTGLYKDASKPIPFICGKEGAGTVLAVGERIDPELVGKRVAFFDCKEGSYSTFGVAEASHLYEIPDGLADETAAALILQGCTAHYLSHDCYAVTEGSMVVVHAAAGGTGLLLCQMCAMKGATVIGICGGAEKAQLAKRVGKATHVIDYQATPDWAAAVRAVAPKGAHAVFDGVGKATFEKSMSVLRQRGAMVSFGNASGPVPDVAPLTLTRHGSVSLQRPSLFHFMDRESGEAQRRVAEVFELARSGALAVTIGQTFPLRDARKAHEALESKATMGKILLSCLE
jgi:NADPH2:quinone reductase